MLNQIGIVLKVAWKIINSFEVKVMICVCVCVSKWHTTVLWLTRGGDMFPDDLSWHPLTTSTCFEPMYGTFYVSLSIRLPMKAARKGRCLCVNVIAGWTTERLSTHRAAPCTILRPTVSQQKCLPKTQPEMLDPGHTVSYYFADTRCEEEVSVIKWRVIKSYFSLSLGVAWQRQWIVSKVVG